MKVLMVGNFLDGSGWANACCNYILALDAAGVKVVPRAFTFNNFGGVEIPQRILELQDNDLYDVDIVIQHCFPHLYSYQAGFKNVGMFYCETNEIPFNWYNGLSDMDQLIVPTNKIAEALTVCGNKNRVDVVGVPIDFDKYQDIKQSAQIPDLSDGFNFCFVGELNKRKNVMALLRAYHTEFHPSENVNLFLSLSGANSDETMAQAEELNNGVIQALGIRQNYKKVIISAGYLEHQDLLSLMNQCHCLVAPSYGEGWCIPAMEAMAMGLPVIGTAGTSMDEFITDKVPSIIEPCYAGNAPEGITTNLEEKLLRILQKDIIYKL
jgi:glycosyltransferase involved in cell wall biosynthesis